MGGRPLRQEGTEEARARRSSLGARSQHAHGYGDGDRARLLCGGAGCEGKAPLALGGLRLQERLERIDTRLQRAAQKKGGLAQTAPAVAHHPHSRPKRLPPLGLPWRRRFTGFMRRLTCWRSQWQGLPRKARRPTRPGCDHYLRFS